MSLATFFNGGGDGGGVGAGGAGAGGGAGGSGAAAVVAAHQLNTLGAYRVSQGGPVAAVAGADPNMSMSAAAYAAAAAATAVHFSGSGSGPFGPDNSTDYDWLFGLNDTLNDTTATSNITIVPHESPLPLWSTIILGALAGICSLVTVLGNAMVLFSFAIERTIRQPTNYYIASLAVSDLLIGVFSMPFFTSYILLGKWPMGPWLCDLWLSLDWTVCLASQYTVFLITMDRFFSVKLPAKYRNWRTERKVIVMIATTWVVPISVFFTCIIGWQFFVGERTVKEAECEVQFMSDPVFLLLLTIGYYWTTLIVMCGLYTGIYRVALTLQRKSEAKHKKIHAVMEMAADHRRNTNSVDTAHNDDTGAGADAAAKKDGKKGAGMTTTSFSSKRSSEKEEERSSSPAFASDDENSSQSPKASKKPSPKDLPQLLCEIGKVPAGLIDEPLAGTHKPKAKSAEQHSKKNKLMLRNSSKSSHKKNKVEHPNPKTSTAFSMAVVPMSPKSTTNHAVVTVYKPAEVISGQPVSPSSAFIAKRQLNLGPVANESPKLVENDICSDQPLGMSASENMRLLTSPPLIPISPPAPLPSPPTVVPATPIEEDKVDKVAAFQVSSPDEEIEIIWGDLGGEKCPGDVGRKNEFEEVRKEENKEGEEKWEREKEEEREDREREGKERIRELGWDDGGRDKKGDRNKGGGGRGGGTDGVEEEKVEDASDSEEEDEEERFEIKSDLEELLGDNGDIQMTKATTETTTTVTATEDDLSASIANELRSSESLSPIWKRRSLVKSAQPSSPSSMQGSRFTVTEQVTENDHVIKISSSDKLNGGHHDYCDDHDDDDDEEEEDEHQEEGHVVEYQLQENEEEDEDEEVDTGDIDGATASLLQACSSEPTLTGSEDTPIKINATRSISGSGNECRPVTGVASTNSRILADPIRPFGKGARLDMATVAAAAVAAASGKEDRALRELQHANSKNNDDISSLSSKRNLKYNSPFQTIVRSLNKPKVRRRSKKEKTKSKSENRARKALRTITFILGAFVLCWTPYHLMVAIIGLCGNQNCVNIPLYQITYWLCYLNSPINPFCYAFANVQFKRTFLRILRLDWHRT